jgi:hypothetical protein
MYSFTGAKVKVDGEARGVTPLDVRVKKTATAMKIELAQTGFETQHVDVTPDRDQRLYFALPKQEKKNVPVKTPAKKRQKPKQKQKRDPGFRRFD